MFALLFVVYFDCFFRLLSAPSICSSYDALGGYDYGDANEHANVRQFDIVFALKYKRKQMTTRTTWRPNNLTDQEKRAMVLSVDSSAVEQEHGAKPQRSMHKASRPW